MKKALCVNGGHFKTNTMKTNIYWPVYKSLEREFINIMELIHVDDKQLSVYSANCASLILRAAADIESIAKELYKDNGGNNKDKIHYDYDALKHLDNLWVLHKKIVHISSIDCFLTLRVRVLEPFKKNEKNQKNHKTYGWNNAYQSLKHDRGASLSKYGTIKYLFDVMAALYILNIYYQDKIIKLGNDSSASAFPLGLGSDIFMIELHTSTSSIFGELYEKKDNFDKCIYLTKATDKSINIMKKITDDITNTMLLQLKPSLESKKKEIKNRVIDKIKEGQISGDNGQEYFDLEYMKSVKNMIQKQKDEVKLMFKSEISKHGLRNKKCEFEGVLNKNQY